MALADRDALKAMLFGRISRAWARRHAPAWLEELEEGDDAPDALVGTTAGGNKPSGSTAPV
jgi:cytochrome b subunit of formate dehydrogenase